MGTDRAVLFANGELRSVAFVERLLEPEDFLIAVDGGSRHMQALRRRPDLLIGDLDSIDPQDREALAAKGVESVVFPVHKDQTDLELALDYAIAHGFGRILVIAPFGGRLDQTLANVALLRYPGLEDRQMRLDDGVQEALLIRDKTELDGQVGDVLSLLPLDGDVSGVSTEGLRYPLHHETLFAHRTRGISNVFSSDRASVSAGDGCLLCIHTRRLAS
jgi:thiamine pyrophosphokinase